MRIERPTYLVEALWRLAEAAVEGADNWHYGAGQMMFRTVLGEWNNEKRSNREIEEQLQLGIITLSPDVPMAMDALFPERGPSQFVLALLAPKDFMASNPMHCSKCNRQVVGQRRTGQANIVVACVECLRTVGIEFNLQSEEPKAQA